ncbi:chorismate mutase [Sphaerisporangium sp. TRM90804]|uniref:chorismate mutase n=1 Tax=Sphaerisporangium sp. TRM90804 TaxID=3031113 RepID=UPI002446814B|nr:chorismate mutase [Sphaerisporangium sp. TRM90804]MDH2428593.1 chorismate mutase [Sphaerisporangium sp. TRM90804]
MSSNGRPGVSAVRIASVTVGKGAAVVVAGLPAGDSGAGGPAGEPGADLRWVSLSGGAAGEALTSARAGWGGPLLAEPGSADDLPLVALHADGVVAGPGDLPLLRAAARLGMPVVVRRGPSDSLDDWLRLAGHCHDEGNQDVVLCEPGGASFASADLALVHAAGRRSGMPVLAAPGEGAGLAAAAVAAGADGLWLACGAAPDAVLAAREAVTVVGALVRPEAPDTVTDAREAIDRVDAALAVLLERRAALAGTVQRLKPVGGFAGRDMDRERRLVAAMARRAPALGEGRLATVMNAVIEAGLHLAEERRSRARESRRLAAPPAGRPRPPASELLAAHRPDHD